MKTTPSSYILVAELVIIVLFHAVKIRQAERHPAELTVLKSQPQVPQPSSNSENVFSTEYMMVNMMK